MGAAAAVVHGSPASAHEDASGTGTASLRCLRALPYP